MALAICFQRLLDDGVAANQAELAALGHVTRARVTQIMNLLNLAPDMQEKLLFLPPVEQVKGAVTDQDLRAVVAELDWGAQRCAWTDRMPT